jgi:Uncharacterized conserved protein, contains double-stranded beta-helix domain
MSETLVPSPATVIRAGSEPLGELAPGVSFQKFASKEVGADGLCTALATFLPYSFLPYHLHEFSEAITVVSGSVSVLVEGRSYDLGPLDCIHIPKMLPHSTVNTSAEELILLTAFANAEPTRQLVDGSGFTTVHYGLSDPLASDPEHVRRYANVEKYELAAGTQFYDLFARRFGAVGICGGYGEFAPGTSLPCHVHDFGESITIIQGVARCEVMGRSQQLSGCDTAFIPRGRPHRFLNESNKTMAMIWVYAGDEPTRTLIDIAYCEGSRPWSEFKNESEV